VLFYTTSHTIEGIVTFGLAGIFSFLVFRVIRRLSRPDDEIA
jgi:hypothetical protein